MFPNVNLGGILRDAAIRKPQVNMINKNQLSDKSIAMAVEMVHKNCIRGTHVNKDAQAVRQKVVALLTHAGECQYALGEVCPCQCYREQGECKWDLYQRNW